VPDQKAFQLLKHALAATQQLQAYETQLSQPLKIDRDP
jgi:hypothetical protein